MDPIFWLALPAAFSMAPPNRMDTLGIDTVNDVVTCLAHPPSWSPTGAETANIETVPVPQTSRRLEPTPECGHFLSVVDRLFEWHVGFGTEGSAADAFDYIENKYAPRLPASSALERAWQAALPDLQQARAEQSTEARVAALQASPPIRQLENLVDPQRKALILAEYAMSAAEEFGSVPMIERAERLLAVAPGPGSTVAPSEEAFPEAWKLRLYTSAAEIDDLRMRAAILRAQLSRSTEDLVRAEALVKAAERPIYKELARSAYSEGPDFCDMDLVGPADEALIVSCRAQAADISERVVTWAVNRTMLDLLTGTMDEIDVNRVLYLLLGERGAGSRCCPGGPDQDILRLRLMAADYYKRRIDRETKVSSAKSHWRMAIFYLRSAAESASPVDGPARFRRIAEAWLHLWARGGSLPVEQSDSRPTESPELQRYASYLRHLLEDLPAIATAHDGRASVPARPVTQR